jgi:hypothetical protein
MIQTLHNPSILQLMNILDMSNSIHIYKIKIKINIKKIINISLRIQAKIILIIFIKIILIPLINYIINQQIQLIMIQFH